MIPQSRPHPGACVLLAQAHNYFLCSSHATTLAKAGWEVLSEASGSFPGQLGLLEGLSSPASFMEPGAPAGLFQGRLDPHSCPPGPQLPATTYWGGGSTDEECVHRLRTSGVKKRPQAKASPIPAGDWVPGGIWPLCKPGLGDVGKKALCHPVPGAGDSGTGFLPNLGPPTGPSVAGSKIRHPDQGSALDGRWD